MARLAVPFEEGEPGAGLRRERGGVARAVSVEGRRRRDERPLVGRERVRQRLDARGLAVERLGEERRVLGVLAEPLERVLDRQVHLAVVFQRHERLALQEERAAVPEQRLPVGHVEQRRRVAEAGLSIDAEAPLAAVGERALREVTRAARDGPVAREDRVEEEPLAERHAVGAERVLRRDRERLESVGHAHVDRGRPVGTGRVAPAGDHAEGDRQQERHRGGAPMHRVTCRG